MYASYCAVCEQQNEKVSSSLLFRRRKMVAHLSPFLSPARQRRYIREGHQNDVPFGQDSTTR